MVLTICRALNEDPIDRSIMAIYRLPCWLYEVLDTTRSGKTENSNVNTTELTMIPRKMFNLIVASSKEKLREFSKFSV